MFHDWAKSCCTVSCDRSFSSAEVQASQRHRAASPAPKVKSNKAEAKDSKEVKASASTAHVKVASLKSKMLTPSRPAKREKQS